MKFTQIINTNSWLSVELTFLKLYPDEKDGISEYENIFNNLRVLKPIDTDITIDVSHEMDVFDKYEYVNVSGYYNDPKKSENDLTSSLALEFTSWAEWLGMDIDKESFRNFSELELICHCLHEMTYFSFEEIEIQQEFDRIKGVADEVKNMTDEEKKEKLIPFEEMKKKFKNKNKH